MTETEITKGNDRKKRIEQAAVLAAVLLVPAALFWGREVIPPIRFLTWHFVSLAWFCVILVAAWGQGRTLAGVILPDSRDLASMPVTIMALGLGLGLFALETFLLGAIGFLTTPALTLLVLLVFILAMITVRRLWPEVREQYKAACRLPAGSGLPLALAGLAVVVSWPFVLVPTRAFDALSYHLEVPLRYLQAGRIIDIPENLYSYAPQLNHMLYGLAMGLSGSDLAGLINHLFFVLTLWALYTGFRHCFDIQAGAWAAALTALSPLMLLEVANSGVDWAAAFYTLAALSVLSLRAGNVRLLIMGGILAGMAAGCRHQPVGYAIFIPVAAGIIDGVVHRNGARLGRWFLFTAVAIATASPWYIRNAVFTGDPLYPLFSNILGKTEAGSGFVSGLFGAKSLTLLWKWAVLPFQMVFDPLSYSMTATIGIQFLVLLPLLLVGRKRTKDRQFLAWWFLLAFLAWYLNFRTARYAMPVLMVGSLWIGSSLAEVLESRKAGAVVLKVVVTVTLVLNGAVFIGLNDLVNRNVGASIGMISSSSYLMDHYEIYPALDYLNQLDPPPGKVLFVGEMRGFYAEFPREVPSHNSPNRLLDLVKMGKELSDIGTELKSSGFTHILYNPFEYKRMAYKNRNAPLWEMTNLQHEQLGSFLAGHTETVFSKNGIDLFRIL